MSPKVLWAKLLGSDRLFCFSSKCKFGSFKNPFATITSLSELYSRFIRIILLVQTKKVISMDYGCSTSHWKTWRWVKFDLILTVSDTFINSNPDPLTKLTSSIRSTGLEISSPWNIFQTITKTILISMRIVIIHSIRPPTLKILILLWLYDIFYSIFRTFYDIFQCFLWYFDKIDLRIAR